MRKLLGIVVAVPLLAGCTWDLYGVSMLADGLIGTALDMAARKPAQAPAARGPAAAPLAQAPAQPVEQLAPCRDFNGGIREAFSKERCHARGGEVLAEVPADHKRHCRVAPPGMTPNTYLVRDGEQCRALGGEIDIALSIF